MKRNNMRVNDRINELKAEIEKLEERYCWVCQDWDCDICWREISEEGGEADE